MGRRAFTFSPTSAPSLPEGTFSKSSNKLTVLLLNQVVGTQSPSYGLRGDVEGFISLKQPRDIERISFKVLTRASSYFIHSAAQVEGQLQHSDHSIGIRSPHVFLARTSDVWKSSDLDRPPTASIPFSLCLPDTMSSPGGQGVPLPPPFDFESGGMQPLRVNLAYAFTITVHKYRGAIFNRNW